MDTTVCANCIEDRTLSEIVERDGTRLRCSVCGDDGISITVQELGQIMEPIMRRNFKVAEEVPYVGDGDDDRVYYRRHGESLQDCVQVVLGQHFDFEDAIVAAIIEADDFRPQDGDMPYWDTMLEYEQEQSLEGRYHKRWEATLNELKHSKRFFSPAAKDLFTHLFAGVEHLRLPGKRRPSVVRTLPTGTKLFRSRVCNSISLLNDVVKAPFKYVGPPQSENARAGRMNADGVTVFYGARDLKTCMAEIRPAIGSDVVAISLTTTRSLRVLDFCGLDSARDGKALSYFQSDHEEQMERRAFLRGLHSLIAQPIVPGHEADYLITQTMAEYLHHVHPKPFDGILFKSAQRERGINVVLFPDDDCLGLGYEDLFGITLADETPHLYRTSSVSYKHEKRWIGRTDDVDAEGGSSALFEGLGEDLPF